MIPTGVAVYVALEPVDMRYSFERLSGFEGRGRSARYASSSPKSAPTGSSIASNGSAWTLASRPAASTSR